MNIIDIVENNAYLFKDSVAVIDAAVDKSISYQELWSKTDAVAYGLISLGISKGDRVALCLPNGAEFIISYFAVLKIGAIVVPFNPILKCNEVRSILENSLAKAIIMAGDEIRKKIMPIREGLPHLQHIIAEGNQEEGCGHISFNGWLLSRKHTPATHLQDDQPAAIHYTSGTTGQMKGAVLSHNNIAANALINGHYLLGLNDQDRVLGLSPFCHVYFFQVVLGPLCVGSCAVSLPRSSPKLALAAIEKYRVTHLSTVPTMFRYLLQQYQESRYDVSSWRVAGSAASGITIDLINEIQSVFKVDFFETFGCTEVSSTITYTRLRHPKCGSVGMPAHGYQVKLVNDKGAEVPQGEVGEIIVKGPGVFSGYWGLPELTKSAFTPDGWFKTGDLAHQDRDGYLYVAGRIKDVIISGGFNIYPRDIEETLLAHPNIADAVVIGKPHKDLGEVPVGYVILKPGVTLNENEIIDFCRHRLAKYKVPRGIKFESDFPRTASGKVQKALFKEEIKLV
ncbi:MAG: class I adenylate-forming enzyme family protein [Dehalobacterium sp.]